MRTFLLSVFFILTVGPAFSQMTHNDSLAGFDLNATVNRGVLKGLQGAELKYFLKLSEQEYLKVKFNISDEAPASSSRFGQGNTIMNAPCVGEDFESFATGNLVSAQGMTVSQMLL